MNKQLTIEDLNNNKQLLYKYLRGSWSHGIGVEGKSDYDYGGVYFVDLESLLSLRSEYQEQISDNKNDETYYEIGRWFELLLKSNPTVLESLFVNKEFVIGDVHPSIQNVINHKYDFLSKEALNPIYFYSVEQVKKSRGLNKKIVNPINERKDVLDFCYTFKNQGSQPIKDWLELNGLDQKYCGLVNVPNMPNTYGVYYDFAAYFKFEFVDKGKYGLYDIPNWCYDMAFNEFFPEVNFLKCGERVEKKEFFKYPGIVNPDDTDESNDVRLCSIPKGEKPICNMTYNKDGYQCHCRKYKEYKEWETKRNPIRYESNLDKNYDAKNMCETVRLIHTGIELAKYGEFNVKRTWDRDFLLDIKNHKYEYDEIMKYVNEKQLEFDECFKTCKLPDKINYNAINKLLIEARKEIYKIS